MECACARQLRWWPTRSSCDFRGRYRRCVSPVGSQNPFELISASWRRDPRPGTAATAFAITCYGRLPPPSCPVAVLLGYVLPSSAQTQAGDVNLVQGCCPGSGASTPATLPHSMPSTSAALPPHRLRNGSFFLPFRTHGHPRPLDGPQMFKGPAAHSFGSKPSYL